MRRISHLILRLTVIVALLAIASPLLRAGPLSSQTPDKSGGIVAAPPGKIDGATIETPGEREFNSTNDASFLEPRNWSVMAYKSRHQLKVYYKGRLFKVYRAVFGRSLESGAKEWAGDRRTPEGLYVIIKKFTSRRYVRFLRLNYPNKVDRYRYQDLRDKGAVPVNDEGFPIATGGAIGIHGTDAPIFNRSNFDWTTGCISVDNDAVIELDRLLPIGTIVVISP